MKRHCSLDEISDGKLYELNDLVEVSCDGCGGRAVCCHVVGDSIILDPYDIYCMSANLKLTFEELLADKLELNVVDGIILPNIKIRNTVNGCAFLNEEGRCGIHAFRPGICRIYPLGRFYDKQNFKYILQVDECISKSSTQVKVSKWIDTPDFERNKRFLIDWHYFLNAVEDLLKNTQDEKVLKNVNMYILNAFYVRKYDKDVDFYEQFNNRLKEARRILLVTPDNI